MTFYSLPFTPERTQATEARLEEEAARIGYELQLDPVEVLNQGVSKRASGGGWLAGWRVGDRQTH
jgi:hypothetical protein